MSDDKAARFRALAAEVAPLDAQAGKLKLEMMALAHSMAVDTLTAAFPKARVVTIQAMIEVKPSNLAIAATEAVKTLTDAGRTPTILIVDTARCLVTVGMETLPPEAKAAKGK